MGRSSQVVVVLQNQLTSEPATNSKVNDNFAADFEFEIIISSDGQRISQS